MRLVPMAARALVAALLASSALFATAGLVLADYDGSCAAGASMRTHMIQQKLNTDPAPDGGGGTVGMMRAGAMKVGIGSRADVSMCDGSGGYGLSAILLTLQQPGGHGGMIQVGIGRATAYDSGNGPMSFLYTPADYTGGGITKWADANNALDVVANAEYEFTIEKTQINDKPRWEVCVDRLDDSSGRVCSYPLRTWGNYEWCACTTSPYNVAADHVWWGFETQNAGDQIGYRSGLDSANYVYDMVYERSAGDTRWYREGFTDCIEVGNAVEGAQPSYYGCTSFGAGADDRIRAWTTDH